MISEHEIAKHCHIRTLHRARQIAASNKNILTKQVRYGESDTTLSAFVASSHGWDDRYRTAVTLNEENDLIVDYSCTCPAYFEYEGICKHAAALVLSYSAAPHTFMGYQTLRTPATSPSIAALMERIKQATATDAANTVRLETTLSYGYGSWGVQFRIAGPEGSYVLKSISEFVGRMRTGEYFSYGMKLAFPHCPSMLTEHTQALAAFLDKAVSLREQANGSASWRYRTRTETERALDLSDCELIELLDLLRSTSFAVKGTDYSTRSITQASVIDEDPLIHISLNRANKNGYHLTQKDDTPFIAHANRMYVWIDDMFYNCSPAFAESANVLRTLRDSEEGQLFISEQDMPLFCATVLPAIEQHLQVSIPAEVNDYRPIPCELEFYFDKTKKGVMCEAHALYGQKRHLLFDAAPISKTDEEAEKNGVGPLRDEHLENKAKTLVAHYFDLPRPFIELGDDEAIAELIFGGLVRFQALGTVFTTPAFDRLLSDKQPHISTGLSLSGNLINLTISTEDLPTNELAALLSSYRKRKRFHRLRSGVFLNLQECNLAQLDQLVNDLGISAKQLSSGAVELPAYQALYLDEQLPDTEKDDAFINLIENFHRVNEDDYQVPEILVHTLRPYQEAGFRWMSGLCDTGFAGILADEMGLGKSVQLISLLLSRNNEARSVGPSLIICPASLVYNWMAELERFAPQLNARVVTGAKRERHLIRETAFRGYPTSEEEPPMHATQKEELSQKHESAPLATKATQTSSPCDILITSYDSARIDADDYAKRAFFCCVLDEAQYVKNHATKTARTVKRIQAHHRFALTGTPIENRPSELWSIFDFLLPGLLGSYMRFRERFELDILGGNEETALRLQKLVGPFVLRRRKSKVLRDLPDKLESVVRVHMEGEQGKLYTAHEQQLRESLTQQRKDRKNKAHDFNKQKVEILAELTKLRQLCCDPQLLYENYTGPAAKLDTIMELIESARDAGEKTLVFSQFTSFLARIALRLDNSATPYYRITGATPKEKRLKLVNAFNDDDTPVFLVSLKAGGTGLNLTGASVVIHADPWWNAAAQNQATDRAHRIGQEKVVSVHKVIAEGTIEERIIRLQAAKSDLADRLVGTGGISLANLSKDELLELLNA